MHVSVKIAKLKDKKWQQLSNKRECVLKLSEPLLSGVPPQLQERKSYSLLPSTGVPFTGHFIFTSSLIRSQNFRHKIKVLLKF